MSTTDTTPRPLAPGIHTEVAEVTITRDKLYPAVARPGPEWHWVYSVAIDGSEPLTHGTRLKDCTDLVRRKYPNATVRRAWEAKR